MASQLESQAERSPSVAANSRRLTGLDGIRGLAALFVVLHHSRLMAFSGFPVDNGPAFASWLLYGHFAVVVFIVLSGFSLAVSPARSGWRLGGVGRFARRRAWRILPPYWAALVFSLAIAWLVVAQPGEGSPTGKSVLLYTFLLQDISGSPSPNGAFWSIAVEAQLYFLFPLMILCISRAGKAAMVATVTGVVALVGLLAPHSAAVDALMRLTPQFAALFAAGAVAAGIIRAPERWQRFPWGWAALAATLPILAMIIWRGSVWTAGHFFWIDLALGPAVAMLLVAVATGKPAPFVRFLDTRPIRSLGSYSYSLYLVHAPIVVVVADKIVLPHVHQGTTALLAILAIAVPVSLIFARLFAGIFELPFQRHRSWPALRAAVRARLRPAPAPAAPAEAEA